MESMEKGKTRQTKITWQRENRQDNLKGNYGDKPIKDNSEGQRSVAYAPSEQIGLSNVITTKL